MQFPSDPLPKYATSTRTRHVACLGAMVRYSSTKLFEKGSIMGMTAKAISKVGMVRCQGLTLPQIARYV